MPEKQRIEQWIRHIKTNIFVTKFNKNEQNRHLAY